MKNINNQICDNSFNIRYIIDNTTAKNTYYVSNINFDISPIISNFKLICEVLNNFGL